MVPPRHIVCPLRRHPNALTSASPEASRRTILSYTTLNIQSLSFRSPIGHPTALNLPSWPWPFQFPSIQLFGLVWYTPLPTACASSDPFNYILRITYRAGRAFYSAATAFLRNCQKVSLLVSCILTARKNPTAALTGCITVPITGNRPISLAVS